MRSQKKPPTAQCGGSTRPVAPSATAMNPTGTPVPAVIASATRGHTDPCRPVGVHSESFAGLKRLVRVRAQAGRGSTRAPSSETRRRLALHDHVRLAVEHERDRRRPPHRPRRARPGYALDLHFACDASRPGTFRSTPAMPFAAQVSTHLPGRAVVARRDGAPGDGRMRDRRRRRDPSASRWKIWPACGYDRRQPRSGRRAARTSEAPRAPAPTSANANFQNCRAAHPPRVRPQSTSRSTMRESWRRLRHSSAIEVNGRYLSITESPKPQALGLSGFSQITFLALACTSRRHQAFGSL